MVKLRAGRKLMGVTVKNLTSDPEELMIQTDLSTDYNMLFEQTHCLQDGAARARQI